VSDQFVEYAQKVVSSHEDQTSPTAIEDFNAAADLLSTDFVIGRYTVGQLLINVSSYSITRVIWIDVLFFRGLEQKLSMEVRGQKRQGAKL
jgi:hypothetical protein